MIDRTARQRAAEAIRHFVTGQITNFQFIDRYPYSKHDPIIWALDDTMWCLYDDIRTHRLAGEDALNPQFKREVARWLMFLYSDEEYIWPRIGQPGFRNSPSWLCRWFGIGRKKFEWFHATGDFSVWPFVRRDDFENARRKPVLLNGNTQQIVGRERRGRVSQLDSSGDA